MLSGWHIPVSTEQNCRILLLSSVRAVRLTQDEVEGRGGRGNGGERVINGQFVVHDASTPETEADDRCPTPHVLGVTEREFNDGRDDKLRFRALCHH